MWDIDKPAGDIAESLVKDLLSNDGRVRVEVKRDRKAAFTGNIAVEYGRDGETKTGVMVEGPKVFWFVLDNKGGEPAVHIPFYRETLIKFLLSRVGRNKKVLGGDGNRTMLILLSLEEISEYDSSALSRLRGESRRIRFGCSVT